MREPFVVCRFIGALKTPNKLGNYTVMFDTTKTTTLSYSAFVKFSHCLKLSLSIFFFFLLSPPPAFSSDAAVLADMTIKPMAEAVQGIKSVLGNRAALFDSAEVSNEQDLLKKAGRGEYKVIITVGSEALKHVSAAASEQTRIVFTLAANPYVVPISSKTTGIRLFPSFYKSLKTLVKIKPGTKNIGVVYNPDASLDMIKELKGAALDLGLNIRDVPAVSPSDAIGKIQWIEREIDAFFLLPDASIYTPPVIDYILLSCFRNKTALVGFAAKHIKKGALMAWTFDAVQIGRQTGEIALSILSGKQVLPLYEPDNAHLEINLYTTELLGLSIPFDIMNSARGYRP
ncbi:MAG: hypothetical protein HZB80_03475 [Deltaproteobacteria bacterium]|nr:hypothetical protein [Deltaproteobacteria bacterium]